VQTLLAGLGFLPQSERSVQGLEPVLYHPDAMICLYEILLRISCRTQLSLYYKGGCCHTNLPSGIPVTTLREEQRVDFEKAILRGRDSLRIAYKYELWEFF
jgi:hypothetical protein